MIYKKLLQKNMFNEIVEHIILDKGNNEFVSFQNIKSNNGPERKQYLEWVAQGNTAEEITE